MLHWRTHILLFLALALVVLLAGCPPKPPAATPTGTPSASTGPAATPPKAAPAKAAKPASEAALTEDVVKRFMASMEDNKIDEIMDGISKELDLKNKKSADSAKQVLDKAAGSKELTEAVKAHGFKDAAEWVGTMKRVLPGMSAAMEKVITEMTGPEAAKQPEGATAQDKFAAIREAFGEPSKADVAIIAKVVKEEMQAEQGGAAKSAP
jgi:hypothetical protein